MNEPRDRMLVYCLQYFTKQESNLAHRTTHLLDAWLLQTFEASYRYAMDVGLESP